MTPEEREIEDIRKLLPLPEFKRFLFRVIQSARIFDRTADGSDGDTAYGRRNLGLEILEMVEKGQPVPHPDGQPLLTILQIIREEANQPGEGKPNVRRKYDRNAELGSDDGDE
jgi:hypothetical protein